MVIFKSKLYTTPPKIKINKVNSTLNMGLKLTAWRSRVMCSTDEASQAPGRKHSKHTAQSRHFMITNVQDVL